MGGIGGQVGVHHRTSLLQSEKKANTGMLFGGMIRSLKKQEEEERHGPIKRLSLVLVSVVPPGSPAGP